MPTARKSKRPPSHRRAVTARPTVRPDVTLHNHGSIVVIVPETTAGREWCEENLVCKETIRFGDGIASEPRYLSDIVEGLRGDGLNVEGA